MFRVFRFSKKPFKRDAARAASLKGRREGCYPMLNHLSDTENIPDADVGNAIVCMITSAKGGVGKSTVCANLGMALAMRGKRVLLIDGDEANRCLDLMTGMESDVVCGLTELTAGTVSPENAVHKHPGNPLLSLLPGTAHFPEDGISNLTDPYFSEILENTFRKMYDVILLDTPGGVPFIVKSTAHLCDRAYIVSSGQATSVRSAAKTAALLSECGIPEQEIIVNQFFEGSGIKKRRASLLSLLSLIDEVGVVLGGVIPFDTGIWDKQNRGLLIDDPSFAGTPFALAFSNIAARFCHESVPLFSRRREYR